MSEPPSDREEGVTAPAAVIAAALEPSAPSASPTGAAERGTRVAVIGLFVLAVLYTLFAARVLLLPIVLAVLLSFILWPVVRGLRRLRVPEALGALVVLAGMTLAVGYAFYALSGPAASWVATAPQALRRIEARLRVVKETVADVQEATSRVEQIATVVGGDAERVVALQGASLSSLLLASTSEVVATSVIILVLTYFLLASGDLFLRKCMRVLPTRRDRDLLEAMARELQESVSGYLFAVTLINAGLGVAVAAAMALVGLPNALLWGAIAATFNFVPYIGSAVGIACVAAASLVTFPTLDQALAPPAVYLLLTMVEAYLVTPAVLSRRFTLNPVVVLVGLLFWGWIWGIPGALIAMPLVMTIKIVCDYVPSLATVGEFLSN